MPQSSLIRLLDIILALIGLVILSPLIILLWVIGYFDTGSPIFRQQRIGRYQQPFTLVKFRTMHPETAHVASHLASQNSITRFGRFLRRSKLDELPQLWNVLKGEMSLVGPRPCLLTQQELIDCRQQQGVFAVRPGITGLAQIQGIDMSTPALLAKTDAEMIGSLTVYQYLFYIRCTLLGQGRGDRVG